MKANIKILYITVGLPGSGKTTWAKSMIRDNRKANHIELDSWGYRNKSLEYVLKSYVRGEEVILDGLFLKENDIVKILTILNEEKIKVNKLMIQYWTPNREACKWNDLYRRDVNSEITIDNAVIDDFNNLDKLKKQFPNINFKIVKNNVVRTEPYKIFANRFNLTLDQFGVVKGESWCTGGTWRDCWGNGGNVSPSAQPDDVGMLDEILEEIAPNITFLQYKKMKNKCVSIEGFSDGDYYGGRTHHQQYVLDVRQLYDYLIENELMEPINI